MAESPAMLVSAIAASLPVGTEWDEREATLLALAAAQAADIERLETDVEERGIRVPSAKGGRDPQPGLAEARMGGVALARLLGQIDIPESVTRGKLAPAALIVQHSDRLARAGGDRPGAAEHLAEIMFWANRHDVQIRSCQDDSTFTNPALAPVMAALMGVRNYEDSKRKSLAVAAGMKRRAERGKPNSGIRPFGYRYGEDGLVRSPPRPRSSRASSASS